MLPAYSRRDLLKHTSCGFGYAALAGLCTEAAADYQNPLAPKAPHFTPEAKRVIFLCMRGGPSHVDTFDYKPQLTKDHGKKSESGLPISDLFPNLSKHADDLCLLNGMYADIPNHPQSYIQLHTGDFRFVRPSVGAWTTYGLGTENQDLPGFITISPESRVGGAQNYGSAFLPAVYQGTRIGQLGQSLSNVTVKDIASSRFSSDIQRDQVDLIQAMNRDLLKQQQVNTELEGVIESYELAFRMQSALPQLMDLSNETEATQKQYGIGQGQTDNFGRQCLLARKFAEAGVRYIELCHANWDQHGALKARLTSNCTAIDKPIAGLMADLKARDMLDDTLIVWGGASLVELPTPKKTMDAITIPPAFRCGWPEAVSKAASDTEPPILTASPRSKTRLTSTTCTQRCCICSVWITRN